jgi:hypothetical protein
LVIGKAENDVFSDHVFAAGKWRFGKETSKTSSIHEFFLGNCLTFTRQTLIIRSVKVCEILGVKRILGKWLLSWKGGDRGHCQLCWRIQ